MSPPINNATCGMPNPTPDCFSGQNFSSFESFNFSAAAGGGFSCSKIGSDKLNSSIRSRPRLTKVRRKQTGPSQNGTSVKLDLGLNGFSSASSEVKLDGESESAFGGGNGNSGSNVGEKSGNVNGSGGGLSLGVNLSDCVFSLGLGKGSSVSGSSSANSSASDLNAKDGKFSFGSNSSDGTNLDVHKENGTFTFGACEAGGSGSNPNLQGQGYVFGFNKNGPDRDTNLDNGNRFVGGNESNGVLGSEFSRKESAGDLRQPKVEDFKFVLRSDKCESTSNVKADQCDPNKSGCHSSFGEFRKVNGARFVFGASKIASVMSNSDQKEPVSGKNKRQDEPTKVAVNTVPDMMGKVKLDASGDSEKVHHPGYAFSSNCNEDSRNYHENFLFGSQNNGCKLRTNLENEPTGKSGDRPNFTNCGKENEDTEIKFQNACLNGAFVFGEVKGKLGFDSGGNTKSVNELKQSNRGKAEGCNEFSEHNYNIDSDIKSKYRNNCDSGIPIEKDLLNKLSNEMKRLSIDGSGADTNCTQSFTEDLSASNCNGFVFGNNQTKDKGENEGINFPWKLEGLDAADSSDSTPNIKFSFSSVNLFPAVEKVSNNRNNKSLWGKRSQKKNGTVKKGTTVQNLFCQDHTSLGGSAQQTNHSPVSGSPMEFSPYKNSNASNEPAVVIGAEIKDLAKAEKETLENHENHDDDEIKSSFAPSSSPAEDGLSSIRRQYMKKYKSKVGSIQTARSNNSDKRDPIQGSSRLTSHEVCEQWRTRGNQAYHAGKLSKAEEFYSMGIDSVPDVSTLGYSLKPLLLCYSNRAATRMSLGRMREAIGDCKKAALLDPNFLKVTLRAGNCYLVLGEVEDAIQCYGKCLGSGTGVCLDRRIAIEAGEGLQKAKRVAEHMNESGKLLQEGTNDAAKSALEIIGEALSVCRYSEKMLEMKGEALCIMRMYNEAIELSEQTLHIAKRNFVAEHSDDSNCKSSHVKLWRWNLKTKCHYHLGRLDIALDMIEQKEKKLTSSKFGSVNQELSDALAASIRELLYLKKSGNEAFNSGRYTEAIEHYTTAISKSVDSRPFMAVCFCNRAAAYQSVSQIVDAIADCSLAIALDENYQKAISRRATLNEMIRDYRQAVCDLQKLIPLLESQSQAKNQSNSQSKSNGASVRDLRKARRHLLDIEEKSKKEIPLDLYLILGIKASDTESEIKKAYRKAALRHHPDKAGQVLVRNDVGDGGTLWKEVGEKIHNDADRLFKVIGEAYAVLSDPSKRLQYDHEEEMRNAGWNNNRNGNSGCPSTSYSSPNGRGSWSGRQSGYTRRDWYDSRSYSNSYSRW